ACCLTSSLQPAFVLVLLHTSLDTLHVSTPPYPATILTCLSSLPTPLVTTWLFLFHIVKREIALFFRQFNQFANAGLDFNRRMQMCHRHFARRFRPRFAIASPSLSENDRLGPERGNFWLLLQAAAESGSLCY